MVLFLNLQKIDSSIGVFNYLLISIKASITLNFLVLLMSLALLLSLPQARTSISPWEEQLCCLIGSYVIPQSHTIYHIFLFQIVPEDHILLTFQSK